MRRIHWRMALTCLLTILVTFDAQAQVTNDHELRWKTLDGGGGTFSAGGEYVLGGSIGQPDAGRHGGANYRLAAGFWSATREQPPQAPGALGCVGRITPPSWTVTLHWIDMWRDGTEVHVERSADGQNWLEVGVATVGASTYWDSNVPANSSLRYRVFDRNRSSGRTSPYSELAVCTTAPRRPVWSVYLPAISPSFDGLSPVPLVEKKVTLLKGSPAAVSWIDTGPRTAVFSMGVDGHLIQRSKSGSLWSWLDHGLPPGTLVDSKPAVAFWQVGSQVRFSIFVKGLNGHLIERWHDGSGLADAPAAWHWLDHGFPPSATDAGVPYARPPSPVAEDPAVITYVPYSGGRRIQVFIKTEDLRLVEYIHRDDGEAWTWIDHGRPDLDEDDNLGDASPFVMFWQTEFKSDFGPYTETSLRVFMTSQEGVLIERASTGKVPETMTWVWWIHDLRNPTSCPFPCFGRLVGTPGGYRFKAGEVVDYRIAARDELGTLWLYDPDRDEGQRIVAPAGYRVAGDPVMAYSPSEGLIAFAVVEGSGWNKLSEYSVRAEAWTPRLISVPAGIDPTTLYSIVSGPAVVGWRDDDQPTISIFANRANGTLIEATRRTGTWMWNDQHFEGLPQIQYSGRASNQCEDNLKFEGFSIGRVLPQWAPVQGATELSYNDEPEVLEGVILRSGISNQDFPFNHSHVGLKFEHPLVGTMLSDDYHIAHDWILHVAPDLKYQHLMADGNFLSGQHGDIEVEWEQMPDKLPVEAAPGVGDRVWITGRHVFDCGHPPPKTEIHPPTALVSFRPEPFVDESSADQTLTAATQAVLRVSMHGGPSDYAPDVPKPVRCPFSGKEDDTEYCKCDDTNIRVSKAVAVSWELIKEWLSTNLGCPPFIECDGIDLSLFTPKSMCYFDLERAPGEGPVSIFDEDANLTPFQRSLKLARQLERTTFEVPFPPQPFPDAVPAWDSLGSAPIAGEIIDRDSDHPRIRVTILGAAVGTESGQDQATVTLRAFWTHPGTEKMVVAEGGRRLRACLNYVRNNAHDPSGIDELRLYFGANSHWLQVPYSSGASPHLARLFYSSGWQCIPINLAKDQTLTLRVSGYECDLDCGELPDDDFASVPNDSIGSLETSFRSDAEFVPGGYGLLSTPRFNSARQRRITRGDAVLFIDIGPP